MGFRGWTPASAVVCSAMMLSLTTTGCQGTAEAGAPPETPNSAAAENTQVAGGNAAEDAKAEAYVREFHTSAAPADWLTAHPLSLEDARAVRAFSKRLLGSGDPQLMSLGRSAAMAAAVNLAGDKQFDEALQAWLDAIQVDFMAANSGPQYDAVRAAAIDSGAKAEQISDPDLHCRFMIVAADASRFKFVTASKAKGTNGAEKLTPDQIAILSVMVEDFAKVADALSTLHPDHREWFLRAREMIVLIARDLGELPDPNAKRFLLQLAPALEKVSASPFDGHAGWNDSRSMELDSVLSALLYEVGKAPLGRSRLESLIADSRAADAHPAAWAVAAGAFYRAERAAGATPETLAPVRKALNDSDARLRARYRSRLGRLMISAALAEAYAPMFRDELFSAPTVTGAFSAVERDKARSLLDDVKLGSPSVPAPLAAEEDQLREAMQTYESNDQLQSDLLGDLQVVSLVPLHMDEGRTDALERLEVKYAAANAGLGSVGTLTDVATVQAALGGDEAFVDYHLIRSDAGSSIGLAGVVLTRATAMIILRPFKFPPDSLLGQIFIAGMQPIESGPLLWKVAEARSGLGGGGLADKELRQLYSLLISPVLATTPPGVRRLVLSPDGVLNLVPFPALRAENGHFLIEDFVVSTVESASIWVAQKKRAAGIPAQLLGVFAPASASGPDSILSVRSEQYPLDPAGDKRFWATEGGARVDGKSAVVAKMQGATAVHFSAHGALSSETADHQTILLGQGASPSTVLDAYEVRHLPIQAWDLVTLGICDGGIMRYGTGDEPYGLVPAFQTAGARNVVAPLWKVNQVADRQFFRDFYAALAKSDAATAYRTVASASIKAGLLPRDWAGYVVVGP